MASKAVVVCDLSVVSDSSETEVIEHLTRIEAPEMVELMFLKNNALKQTPGDRKKRPRTFIYQVVT